MGEVTDTGGEERTREGGGGGGGRGSIVRSSHGGSDGEARGKQLGVMSSLGTTD